ncbi:hypothetical protein Bca4012_075000 [Brassica carinata]
MNLTGFTPAKFFDVLDGSLNTDYLVEDRSVSNAYNVSDIAINPSMNEVQAFLALWFAFGNRGGQSSSNVSMISEKEDFFIHIPRKTISEVLESRQV